MRSYSSIRAGVIASTIAAACTLAWSTARAHPGHGDAAHFLVGGAHEGESAQQLLAHPLFAVALLVASVLALTVTSAVARARSRKPPRRATRD